MKLLNPDTVSMLTTPAKGDVGTLGSTWAASVSGTSPTTITGCTLTRSPGRTEVASVTAHAAGDAPKEKIKTIAKQRAARWAAPRGGAALARAARECPGISCSLAIGQKTSVA